MQKRTLGRFAAASGTQSARASVMMWTVMLAPLKLRFERTCLPYVGLRPGGLNPTYRASSHGSLTHHLAHVGETIPGRRLRVVAFLREHHPRHLATHVA